MAELTAVPIAVRTAGRMAVRTAEQISVRTAVRTAEQISVRTAERTAEQISVRTAEQMAERTAEQMAAQTAEPFAEDSVLSRLVAVDRDQFASRYWGQEPLLSPAADLPGGITELLDANAIDELVSKRGL